MDEFWNNGLKYNNRYGMWIHERHSDFEYSDGEEIENRLFAIVSSASDVSLHSQELRSKCIDWPSSYHLHPSRANLLRSFEKHINGSVLEVGAGCGAITRYLGETGIEVAAVEGSLNRARIAAARTRDQQNVTVINANFNDLDISQKFNFVLLIGVLEYAGAFSDSTNPHVELLKKAKSHLKDDGVLIIAIENQLGLKYFAGALEDHLSKRMVGLHNHYPNPGVRTWGLGELDGYIKSSGFPLTHYAYPFPDYKFPRLLLRQKSLNEGQIINTTALIRQVLSGDMQIDPSRMQFAQECVHEAAQRNGLTAELSNSFLILASENPDVMERISNDSIAAEFYSTNRQKIYCKSTQFIVQDQDILVTTCMLHPNESREHLSSNQFQYVMCPEQPSYERGNPLSTEFQDIVSQEGWTLRAVFELLSEHLNFIYSLENGHSPQGNLDLSLAVSGSFIDAVPINVLRGVNGLVLIDQEWRYRADISYLYLLFRSITVLFRCCSFIAMPADSTIRTQKAVFSELFRFFGHDLNRNEVENFLLIEAAFMDEVLGYQVDPIPYDDWAEFACPYSEFHSSRDIRSIEQHVSDLQNLAGRYMDQIRWLESENERRRLQEEGLNNQITALKADLYDKIASKSAIESNLKKENENLKILLSNFLLRDHERR
ncbi:class I SAM-dependent methyltransferase [Methylorubrum thiocyanatum]|uniref:class I SAM-dependent methyltransferase n=1 Tax=Methylorubrum thiocyanatum TaxID=47958 RepID=UPI00398C54C2